MWGLVRVWVWVWWGGGGALGALTRCTMTNMVQYTGHSKVVFKFNGMGSGV